MKLDPASSSSRDPEKEGDLESALFVRMNSFVLRKIRAVVDTTQASIAASSSGQELIAAGVAQAVGQYFAETSAKAKA